jgi:hypothetical protein
VTSILPALLIGVVAGMRAMTAPAAVSWAAALGWLVLGDSPLLFLAHPVTRWVFTLFAIAEFVTDQLPTTPRRTVPVQFGTRVGHARFESPTAIRVGEALLAAPRIFLDVGGRAHVPDLPGIDRVPYLTNTSILGLSRVPRHLAVVGGSYIGLEFGQIYRRFGAEVTIEEMGPRLIGREDPDVSDAIRGILEGEGVGCGPAPRASRWNRIPTVSQ